MIGNHGKPTSEKCPRCESRVVYNGNHFCEHWGDGCDWALPHPQVDPADRLIAYRLNGYWEVGEAEANGEAIWVISRENPSGRDGKGEER